MPDKKQTTKKEKDLICGMTKDYIRKKYFTREIGLMLAEIQAKNQVEESEIQDLISFMTDLQSEDKSMLEKVMAAFPGSKIVDDSEIKPPSVDELMKGVSDDEWRKKADVAIKFVSDTLQELKYKISSKEKIPDSYWLDIDGIFMSYEEVLVKDMIFKGQKFYARLTNIIDETGCSRLEAENRAKLTKEYADYKYLLSLTERMDKFDMFCKKKDGETKKY